MATDVLAWCMLSKPTLFELLVAEIAVLMIDTWKFWVQKVANASAIKAATLMDDLRDLIV